MLSISIYTSRTTSAQLKELSLEKLTWIYSYKPLLGGGGGFLHSFDLKNMILTHTMYFYKKIECNLCDLGLSINPILKYNQIQGWSGP
jgi:hypothetical protein